jgi:ABC-2 type transport system ATP-binding protein
VLHDVERVADKFGFINQGQLLTIQSPNDLLGGEHRVTIRSQGTSPVAGFSPETPGRWVGEVTRDDLWKALEDLRAAGHQVSEIKPTLTLESAFFRFLGRAGE